MRDQQKIGMLQHDFFSLENIAQSSFVQYSKKFTKIEYIKHGELLLNYNIQLNKRHGNVPCMSQNMKTRIILTLFSL